MSDPAVSILSDTVCELGEGPGYERATATLWWFDIVASKLLELRDGASGTLVHDLPMMASAIAPVDAERQLLVTENGLYLRDRSSGDLTLYRSVEAENQATRSNDARVHPCGALWFGTMAKNESAKAGAIYWHFQGEVRQLYPEISIPNSICFSGDGATAFFADSARNILFRVACDPDTGLPVDEPAIFLDHRGRKGGIDGSVIDDDGILWNARWGAASLDAYDPAGRHIRSIAMPAVQSSCPAFIGEKADRIAVTSAWKGMDQSSRAADPHAGKTFIVDLPVRGRFEPSARL